LFAIRQCIVSPDFCENLTFSRPGGLVIWFPNGVTQFEGEPPLRDIN